MLIAISQWILFFIANVVMTLASPVVVAIALPFASDNHLPAWAWYFDNAEDGLNGDARGWYWNEYFPAWVPGWYKRWHWAGWRNPANNFKRYTIGIDIREYKFELAVGDKYVRDDLSNTGFQILKAIATRRNIQPRYMLYWVRRWGKTNRAIVFQFGHKMKLRHNAEIYDNELDYWKGFTFEPQLFKDIS